MLPVEEQPALEADIAADTPDVIKATMPNGAVIYYRDSDHSYWKGHDPKTGACSGRVANSSGISKCDGDTNGDGLLWWAHGIARRGGDWEAERRAKGDIGNGAHAVLEALAAGLPVSPVTPQEHAVYDWWTTRQPEPLQAEEIVYSQEHGFAGRLDLFAAVRERLGVWDLKTGSRLTSGGIQVNLYEIARREVGFTPADELWLLQVNAEGQWLEVPVPIRPDWALNALRTFNNGKEIRSILAAARKQALAA